MAHTSWDSRPHQNRQEDLSFYIILGQSQRLAEGWTGKEPKLTTCWNLISELLPVRYHNWVKKWISVVYITQAIIFLNSLPEININYVALLYNMQWYLGSSLIEQLQAQTYHYFNISVWKKICWIFLILLNSHNEYLIWENLYWWRMSHISCHRHKGWHFI